MNRSHSMQPLVAATAVLRRVRAVWFPEPSAHLLTRWLFLRLLGIIYGIAFVSLWTQIGGLAGHHGILPAAEFLDAVRAQAGLERFWLFPTLCWWSASDGFLHALCAGGAVLSLLVVAGVAPGLSLALLWLFYLSLSIVCREFLSFQWDILLLESGFLAIFIAPRQWRPRLAAETPPSRTVIWLLRWLLFRLMFMSGAVKLLSADQTWWNLTALDVHYETQPLPTWVGWHAHQMPAWTHHAAVAIMFAVELAVPAFIFGGRHSRRFAAGAVTVFMLAVSATGNYGFFNPLTIALCVLLLDDAMVQRFFPQRMLAALANVQPAPGVAPARRAGVALLAGGVVCISGVQTLARLTGSPPPALFGAVVSLVAPLRTVNSYGLFAVMTTTRPEIILEASQDGVNWWPYEFKWKPGDGLRRPGFVAPHQPRLDWQMWFAALGSYEQNPWLINFQVRLLQGAPEVLALLKENPFPERPPQFVRAVLYQYHFADRALRDTTGEWWWRERKGLYSPPMSLRQPFRLQMASDTLHEPCCTLSQPAPSNL